MSKKPPVVFTYNGTGLTGESAYLWALFLAREAEMDDNLKEFAKWKHMADSLRPRESVPLPANFYSGDLMNAIEKYTDHD